MKKNKDKKAPREDGLGLKVLLILGFIFSASCLIVGIVLMGVYFKNFDIYMKLLHNWAGGPGFNEQVSDHNSNYSSYKDTTDTTWVYASYSLFTVGIVFVLVGFATLGLFIFLWKKNQHKFLNKQKDKYISRGSVERKVPSKHISIKPPSNT